MTVHAVKGKNEDAGKQPTRTVGKRISTEKPAGKTAPTERVQLLVTTAQAKFMDDMVEESLTITSRRELLFNAMRLFRWVLDEKKKGRVVGSLDPKKNTTEQEVHNFYPLVFPGLD